MNSSSSHTTKNVNKHHAFQVTDSDNKEKRRDPPGNMAATYEYNRHQVEAKPQRRHRYKQRGLLTSLYLPEYVLVVMLVFSCLSLVWNVRQAHNLDTFAANTTFMERFPWEPASITERQQLPRVPKHQSATPTSSLKSETKPNDMGAKQPRNRLDVQKTKNKRHHHNSNHHHNKHTDVQAQEVNHHALDCKPFGGPDNEVAQEMVYWKDIPSDNQYTSPFHPLRHHTDDDNAPRREQFMTFEPDHGGWNNIRMAMETAMTMAMAMGRTLVLPPRQKMYLLGKDDQGQRNEFSFEDFFPMDQISQEHVGLKIITMKEFLEDHVLEGYFVPLPNVTITTCNKKRNHYDASSALYPPRNRTNWDGSSSRELGQLYKFLRNNTTNVVPSTWNPEHCLAAFPQSTNPSDTRQLFDLKESIETSGGFPDHTHYIDKPTPVNASAAERLKENWANRKELCVYDTHLQTTPWIHFRVERKEGLASRLLVHFYAFLFFQDWQQDLWMKRFVRDHVRYIDMIQCAAARIVQAIRRRVLERTNGTSTEFDTLHVRRGDFQYTNTRVEAWEIYEMTKRKIQDGTTVYIATDEQNKTFFDDLQQHYDVIFLDDFLDEIAGLNTNYYGMVDQLVASRGRIFFGCFFSTFTGYINRLRGYHYHHEHNHDNNNMGMVPSYYYSLKERFDHMQHFWPIKKSLWSREFPTSWRLIDTGVTPPKTAA